jgi:nucleoid-associated protein YgaU
MGLFSFVKNAGAKLFGKKDTKTPEQENAEKAAAIKAEIQKYKIQIDYLKITVDDDKVTLSGICATKAGKEKAVLIAGNVDGIASVDDQLEVAVVEKEEAKPRSVDVQPKEEAKTVFYTVVKGDTLWKIADQHYNDGAKYPVIFEANKPMLEHPDKIYPGQMLRIPALDAEA